MSMGVGGGGGPKSDINVTPYIDILLVLLIIFMVITPVSPMGFDVRVPKKVEGEISQEDANRIKSIVVMVKQDAKLLINNDMPASFDDLEGKLVDIYRTRMDKRMFIMGEKTSKYSDIVKVIEIAKRAGVNEIGLMTLLDDQKPQ